MKKFLCMMIAIFMLSTSVYAIEVSAGASLGAGLSFLMGGDVETLDNMYEPLFGNKSGCNFGITVDVMIEFLPFLALETGLALDFFDNVGYQGAEIANGSQFNFQKFLHLNIPLMLRAQYDLGVTYASIGLKMAFPTASSSYAFSTRGNNNTDDNSIYQAVDILKAAPFYLDIAFAI